MKDWRIKVMRFQGVAASTEKLVGLIERTQPQLKERGIDILAPIQTKKDGSLLKGKIVFISEKGLNSKKLASLSREYKVYLSIHYLDYQELKEYYFVFKPTEGMSVRARYAFRIEDGESVFAEDSPVTTGELHQWIN